MDLTKAAADVLAERAAHKTREKFSDAHDDKHTDGSIGRAAACYADPHREMEEIGFFGSDETIQIPRRWPKSWASRWWKPKDRRRDLVHAGALILAEIERLDRIAARKEG